MNGSLTRSRMMVLTEFEQLLNLVFAANARAEPMSWREDPFHSAIQTFIRDSVAIVAVNELVSHSKKVWLPKRRSSLDANSRKSFYRLSAELLSGGV